MHWGGAGGNRGLVPDPPSLPPKDLRSGGGGRQGARPSPIWRCGLLSIRTHADFIERALSWDAGSVSRWPVGSFGDLAPRGAQMSRRLDLRR